MKHKTLYGTYAKNPCAYCRLHRVSLTIKQLKGKKCLQKQCRYLSKYKHEYWDEREAIKQLREQRKQKFK